MTFVVLGTGRSGTGWTSKALAATGLVVGHEDVYDHRPDSGSDVRWHGYDGDVSLAAAGWPDRLPDVRPLVVRHPLAVIDSFMALRFWHERCECHEPGAHLGSPYATFFLERAPSIGDEADAFGRCVAYVDEWLDRCMAMATMVVTLDDMIATPSGLVAMCEHIGAPCTGEVAQLAIDANGVVNTKDDVKHYHVKVSMNRLTGHPRGQRIMDAWERAVSLSSDACGT